MNALVANIFFCAYYITCPPRPNVARQIPEDVFSPESATPRAMSSAPRDARLDTDSALIKSATESASPPVLLLEENKQKIYKYTCECTCKCKYTYKINNQ